MPAALPKITNQSLWDAIREKFPNFMSHTAKGTKDLFTESGYEMLTSTNPNFKQDYFELSMRVYLQLVTFSYARDTLASNGFGEYFPTPRGGYVQRIAIDSIKPISPGYRGLQTGDSPDPFVVRKASQSERMWKQNFDYQSLVTIPDDYAFKTIFITEYGMSELMGGIMQGLENGYTIQLYENKLEVLNAAINSTQTPLQNTQVYEVDYTNPPAAGTQQEQKELWLAIKSIIDAMVMGPQTWGFNAMKYASVQERDRIKVLIRPGYKNQMTLELYAVIFNADRLNMDVDIIEVPHFGGLIPQYMEGSTATDAKIKYDEFGAAVAYTKQDGTTVVPDDQITWLDPNADVIAIVADKGMVFYAEQNPYQIEAIRNPRGLYTNFWASSPGNSVNYDPLFNMVVIKKASAG